MQTGVINNDNISQILRGISQRRRQGLLEITFPELTVQILFVQGRVVDIICSDVDSVGEVLSVLKKGGMVPASFDWDAGSYGEMFRGIGESLEGDEALTRELFKKVVQHRILDRFYAFEFGEGAYYSFKVQMVEADRDYCPSISVGQLLLDLVSIENSQERFVRVFTSGVTVRRKEGINVPFSEDEEMLYGLIGPNGICLEELADGAMLSRYHLQEALLELYDREIVKISEAGSKPAKAKAKETAPELDETAFEDMASLLEDTIDGVFEEESKESPPSKRMKKSVEEDYEEDASEYEDEDEEEEYDEEEYDDEDLEALPSGLGLTISIWNSKLLAKSLAPHIVAFLFFLCALLGPLLFWTNVFKQFSH